MLLVLRGVRIPALTSVSAFSLLQKVPFVRSGSWMYAFVMASALKGVSTAARANARALSCWARVHGTVTGV